MGRDWEEIVTSGCFQVDNNIYKKFMEGDVILLMLNTHTYAGAHEVLSSGEGAGRGNGIAMLYQI